ncbi:hypothetical protein BDQ17DRAFT_1331334 [Cyathus striatus]|nr:hypothetical protein BDQ17DRAFT_1331334 [Cyathus striatus]
MHTLVLSFVVVAASVALLVLYIKFNDARLRSIPEDALSFSPMRCTPEHVRRTARRLAASPISLRDQLPPKTGRRYIIVGGGGFLGSWIAALLLERGEHPANIRLLDLNPPVNYVVKDALNKGVQYVKVDVSDYNALEAAFTAPWADDVKPGEPQSEISIFHTAANIRFYERYEEFLDRSAKVNVDGTENVINAARVIGATVLVYTSSGSVGLWRTRLLLWPWEKTPERVLQVVNDDDSLLPKKHDQFFSNYAVTKRMGERLVRAADGSSSGESVLRTGCLRPGNGIFGPRGDILCGAYLVRQTNPTWIENIIQSFVYVENCALAHLCYEQRLVELQAGSKNPDIGGQAFCISDPGPIPTYGDVYTTLETLTDGECHFPSMSPTGMLLIAYIFEWIYRTRNALSQSSYSFLANILPKIQGDLVNLQPSLFFLTEVHLIFDDSRARLPPEQGGLGYRGAWTTFEGLHKTVEEYKSGVGKSDTRSAKAGVSLKLFGSKANAQRAVAIVDEKVVETIAVGPVEMLSI